MIDSSVETRIIHSQAIVVGTATAIVHCDLQIVRGS
jgi:hypothetical protein